MCFRFRLNSEKTDRAYRTDVPLRTYGRRGTALPRTGLPRVFTACIATTALQRDGRRASLHRTCAEIEFAEISARSFRADGARTRDVTLRVNEHDFQAITTERRRCAAYENTELLSDDIGTGRAVFAPHRPFRAESCYRIHSPASTSKLRIDNTS